MRSFPRRSVPALLLAAALTPGAAHAAMYAVNASAVGGSIGFTGLVNTTADTFTLLTVTDGAGGSDFWTNAAPIVMNAVDAVGGAYDVPDAWDGTIDSTWGFHGPDLGTIAFNEGSVASAWSDWSTGWGAMTNSSGTYITSQTHLNALANWPFFASNSVGYWITQPSHGPLTVTLVPAPSTAALLALGAGATGVRRRRPTTAR